MTEKSLGTFSAVEALRNTDRQLYWEMVTAVLATDILAKSRTGVTVDQEFMEHLKFAATNAEIYRPDIQGNIGGTYGVACLCMEEVTKRDVVERVERVLPGYDFRDISKATLVHALKKIGRPF